MAFNNQYVKGIQAKGVGKTGNPAPLANLPANNTTNHAAPLGTSHTPPLGKSGAQPSKAANAAGIKPNMSMPSSNGIPNMPAKNKGNDSYTLGTTHHGVGSVPGYLRGKNTQQQGQ